MGNDWYEHEMSLGKHLIVGQYLINNQYVERPGEEKEVITKCIFCGSLFGL